jgi:hypothetical protein
MIIKTTRTFILSEKEYNVVKARFACPSETIEESVMQYLATEHDVRIDIWLYQYHEEEGKGFKIILADEGCEDLAKNI